MSDSKEMLNVYEYLTKKLNTLIDEIGKVLLEGDAYFQEWEAIASLFTNINRFLDYLRDKKEIEEGSE
jgi:hypothetical protein